MYLTKNNNVKILLSTKDVSTKENLLCFMASGMDRKKQKKLGHINELLLACVIYHKLFTYSSLS